jgi:hypothetical protein
MIHHKIENMKSKTDAKPRSPQVAITAEQHLRVKLAATREGISIKEWLRNLIDLGLRGKVAR